MQHRVIFIFIIFFTMLIHSYGAIYFVDSTVTSGSGTGTKLSPFNLQDAFSGTSPANVITAGDVIYVRGGTYTNTGNFLITVQGGANNRISFKAYPGERPILNGEGNVALRRAILLISRGAKYVDIVGLEVTNHDQDCADRSSNVGVTPSERSSGIKIDTAECIWIIKCKVYDVLGNGIEIHPHASRCKLSGNECYHNGYGYFDADTTESFIGAGIAASNKLSSPETHILRNNITHSNFSGGISITSSALGLNSSTLSYNNFLISRNAIYLNQTGYFDRGTSDFGIGTNNKDVKDLQFFENHFYNHNYDTSTTPDTLFKKSFLSSHGGSGRRFFCAAFGSNSTGNKNNLDRVLINKNYFFGRVDVSYPLQANSIGICRNSFAHPWESIEINDTLFGTNAGYHLVIKDDSTSLTELFNNINFNSNRYMYVDTIGYSFTINIQKHCDVNFNLDQKSNIFNWNPSLTGSGCTPPISPNAFPSCTTATAYNGVNKGNYSNFNYESSALFPEYSPSTCKKDRSLAPGQEGFYFENPDIEGTGMFIVHNWSKYKTIKPGSFEWNFANSNIPDGANVKIRDARTDINLDTNTNPIFAYNKDYNNNDVVSLPMQYNASITKSSLSANIYNSCQRILASRAIPIDKEFNTFIVEYIPNRPTLSAVGCINDSIDIKVTGLENYFVSYTFYKKVGGVYELIEENNSGIISNQSANEYKVFIAMTHGASQELFVTADSCRNTNCESGMLPEIEICDSLTSPWDEAVSSTNEEESLMSLSKKVTKKQVDKNSFNMNNELNKQNVQPVESISLRPNPAHTTLNVETTNKEGISNIQILDNTGKVITSTPVQSSVSHPLNVENLAKGIYFIGVKVNNKTIFTKFIKE